LSESPHYSIGHDIVSRYEAELLAALPSLYPNEGERSIVEEVLIPQFRLKLGEVFDGFMASHKYTEGQTIKSKDIPELCKDIDQMLRQNRELLDIKGVFAPAYAIIAQHRKHIAEELESAQIQQFRDILAAHGITDRESLLHKGSSWFMKANFPPCGKAFVFAKAVLGRSIAPITTEILEEIAAVLELPEIEESSFESERLQQLKALAAHGITDRQSLLAKGAVWFMKTDFPPYGKGAAFSTAILGRPAKYTSIEIIEEIADRLGFEGKRETGAKLNPIQVLAAYNVTDRESLLAKGSFWFNEADFPQYGSGRVFAGHILGRTILYISAEVLEEIADKLAFPKLDENQKKQYQLSILAAHGIADRQSLLAFGISRFIKTEFAPYGKGKNFAIAIIGHTFSHISKELLEKVADILGFSKLDESQERQNQFHALMAHGISDRKTLLGKGSKWFMNADFPPYGSGRIIAGVILGRSFKIITENILEEIADALGFKESQEKHDQLNILATHSITDRKSLLGKGPVWFMKTDFPPFGKGVAFFGAILGRSIPRITEEILEAIAEQLDFPKIEESQAIQNQLNALAVYNIHDRKSLLAKGPKWFVKKADFPPYGGGRAFATVILGRPIKYITADILGEIADALFTARYAQLEKTVPLDSTLLDSIFVTLKSALPKLYPKQDEREIVEQVLIPQLRIYLEEVLRDFNSVNPREDKQPLTPIQIEQFFSAVESKIKENAQMLDASGLGNKLMKVLTQVNASLRKRLEAAYEELESLK